MITIKRIETTDDMMNLIEEQQKYREDLGRYRSQYIYRGEQNIAFHLSTSLMRNCKDHQSILESKILRNFTKYAAFENPRIRESIWQQMILGQHHGLPTRLLDWSHSPLIALHFSVTEPNPGSIAKHDSIVWRMDISELHSLLPQKYRDALDSEETSIFTVDLLNTLAPNLTAYDSDMKDQAMVILEPPSIDPRIISQYSFFSVIPSQMTDIEAFLNNSSFEVVKYVIAKELKWYVRDLLDQMNISERTIYPGLDGLSRWLARHYFVQ